MYALRPITSIAGMQLLCSSTQKQSVFVVWCFMLLLTRCRDLKAYIAYLEMGHKNPESLDLKRRTDLLAHSEHTSQKEDKALSESSGTI